MALINIDKMLMQDTTADAPYAPIKFRQENGANLNLTASNPTDL